MTIQEGKKMGDSATVDTIRRNVKSLYESIDKIAGLKSHIIVSDFHVSYDFTSCFSFHIIINQPSPRYVYLNKTSAIQVQPMWQQKFTPNL